jgi:hypothetical protein
MSKSDTDLERVFVGRNAVEAHFVRGLLEAEGAGRGAGGYSLYGGFAAGGLGPKR